MKMLNKLTKRFGSKNILQFGLGVTVVSVTLLLSFIILGMTHLSFIVGLVVGTFLTGAIAYYKELNDTVFSIADIYLSIIGSYVMALAVTIIYFITL